jgi:integrase
VAAVKREINQRRDDGSIAPRSRPSPGRPPRPALRAGPRGPGLDLAGNRIVLPADFSKAREDQEVPLDAELRADLERLPRQGEKVFRFTTRVGREIGPSGVGMRVARLARKAGVRLTAHDFRRGFISYYAARVPAAVLKELARHSDLNVTGTYYVNAAAAAEAVRARSGRARIGRLT